MEAAARELEAQKRQKAMDISGNKLDLSGEARKNKVAGKTFFLVKHGVMASLKSLMVVCS